MKDKIFLTPSDLKIFFGKPQEPIENIDIHSFKYYIFNIKHLRFASLVIYQDGDKFKVLKSRHPFEIKEYLPIYSQFTQIAR